MAQSLEELSSIYSEASELGLTSLGVTQPHSLQHQQHGQHLRGMMVLQQQQQHSTGTTGSVGAAVPAGGARVMGDGGGLGDQQQEQLQQHQQQEEVGGGGELVMIETHGEVVMEEEGEMEARELDYDSDQVSQSFDSKLAS